MNNIATKQERATEAKRIKLRDRVHAARKAWEEIDAAVDRLLTMKQLGKLIGHSGDRYEAIRKLSKSKKLYALAQQVSDALSVWRKAKEEYASHIDAVLTPVLTLVYSRPMTWAEAAAKRAAELQGNGRRHTADRNNSALRGLK